MEPNETNLVLVMKRVFKTDPETLFEAWTDPRLMAQWFHAKDDWTTPVAEADLRVGGSWRVEMRSDQGQVYPNCGEYRVIDKPRQLAFTWHPHADMAVHTLVTLRFTPQADGTTELVLTHEGLRTQKEKDQHNGGWMGCLGTLESWVRRKG